MGGTVLGWGARQGFEGLWVLWDHEVGMGFVGPPKPIMAMGCHFMALVSGQVWGSLPHPHRHWGSLWTCCPPGPHNLLC